MPFQQPQDRLAALEAARQQRLQAVAPPPEALEAARQQRVGTPEPTAQATPPPPNLDANFIRNAIETFGRTNPIPFHPIQMGRDMIQAQQEDPVGFLAGPLKGVAAAVTSGALAPLDIARGDITGGITRAPNIALGLDPMLGSAFANEAVQPLSRGVTMDDVPNAERAASLGQAAGATAGLGLSVGLDNKLMNRAQNKLKAARELGEARESGILMSMGQEPGAGFATRAVESVVSRLPGGRNVIQRFRNNQQVQIVQNGVNRLLEGIATFDGSKSAMTQRIQNGVLGIIEQLKVRNRGLYDDFDQSLARSRTAGRPVSFLGDSVADVADQMLGRLGAEARLVGDPAIDAIVRRVRALSNLRGEQISVVAATDARSTLLALARRMDNPLPGKELRLVNQVFEPIDQGIEGALRAAGGDDLVEQWRTANAGVREAHELIDGTLFDQVAKMRNPEDIASVMVNAPERDLIQMRARLSEVNPDLWDQTAAMILRDELARRIQGESAIPARGRRGQGGRPLEIGVDPGITPQATGNFIEAANSIEESRRAILLPDETIRELSKLEGARQATIVNDQIATLIGSSIAGASVMAVPPALLGAAVGGAAGVTGLGAAVGGFAGLTIGAKVAAEFLTHPEWLQAIAARTSQAGAGAVTASVVGQQMANTLSREALLEFISDNNIPATSLSLDVQQRLAGSPVDRFQGAFENFTGR